MQHQLAISPLCQVTRYTQILSLSFTHFLSPALSLSFSRSLSLSPPLPSPFSLSFSPSLSHFLLSCPAEKLCCVCDFFLSLVSFFNNAAKSKACTRIVFNCHLLICKT